MSEICAEPSMAPVWDNINKLIKITDAEQTNVTVVTNDNEVVAKTDIFPTDFTSTDKCKIEMVDIKQQRCSLTFKIGDSNRSGLDKLRDLNSFDANRRMSVGFKLPAIK